jgi:hypothetical protein
MKNWSLGFRENHVTFPENLVTFHKLLQPTIAVGHDGSPSGGQTMECHKQNDEPNQLGQQTEPPDLLLRVSITKLCKQANEHIIPKIH